MKRTVIALPLFVVLLSCLARDVQHVVAGAKVTGGDGPSTRTQVVLLGTGTPNADPDRSGPSVAIVVNDAAYLVDCGPGLVRRAAAAYQAGVSQLKVSNLRHLFVTHLHSDHTTGYPDLIFTPWVLGRKQPLEVYGPVGIKAMTDHLLKAYDQDIHVRIDGPEGANTEGYKVNVHEIQPGVIYQDENVTVKAFPVRHGSWPHAFGFRFETADRSVVVSGDTVPCASLLQAAEGCDVLVHEVYCQSTFNKRSPKWQNYHSASHTSTLELGRIAAQVQPGLLILYHQLYWGATDDDLLNEIRREYSGRVVSGEDLHVY